MKLIQIGDYWIDPSKVISVVPYGGANEFNQFFVHVDMGGWTASHDLISDREWNPTVVAALINEARS